MKQIVLLNGSPRTDDSTSGALCQRFADRFGAQAACTTIHVRKRVASGNCQPDFSLMAQADAIIAVFPLYFFCVPAVLDRFLVDYADYLFQNKIAVKQAVYAVVNCGFPEADINREAAQVIASFAKHNGAQYRFSILIGGGGMLIQPVPPAQKALAQFDDAFGTLFADLDAVASTPAPATAEIEIPFPRFLYYFGGNMGWYSIARKNGLKRKDLRRAPYGEAAK